MSFGGRIENQRFLPSVQAARCRVAIATFCHVLGVLSLGLLCKSLHVLQSQLGCPGIYAGCRLGKQRGDNET